MQDNEGYAPLRFRSALVPANFGSKLLAVDPFRTCVRRDLAPPLVEIRDPDVLLAVLFQS